MPPSREERDAWLRLATTDVAAFNQAIHDVDGQFRVDLRGADLSGRDLSSLQLGRSDLRGARLRGATVHAGTLVSCRLQDTELTDVRYVDAGDDHAMPNLKMLRPLVERRGPFNAARGEVESFDLADLSQAQLGDANLSSSWIGRGHLAGANVSRCRLYKTAFTDGNLSGARFTGNTLERLDLHGSDLSDADFDKAQLLVCTCPRPGSIARTSTTRSSTRR